MTTKHPHQTNAPRGQQTEEAVHNLKKDLEASIEVILDYVHYKQKTNENANIQSLGLYALWCYVQGQLKILNVKRK